MTKEQLWDEYEVMYEIEVACGYDKWYQRGAMTEEEYQEALDQFREYWENRFREEGYDIDETDQLEEDVSNTNETDQLEEDISKDKAISCNTSSDDLPF